MPQQVFRPSTVVVSSTPQPGGETHLKITLELNINLNSNGIEATVSTKKVEETTSVEFSEEEVQHIIPDFNPGPTIEFGKKVEEERWQCVKCGRIFISNRPTSNTCAWCLS